MRHPIKYFLLFIVILLYAVTAFAQFAIYSHNNVSTDDCWVQPCIRIQNISNNWIHLKNYTIEYYFYDANNSASQYVCDVWYFSNGSSRVYTSFVDYTPPFTNGPKKANIKCVITFSTSNYNILYGNGYYDELELGIRKGWAPDQDQTDDWSYLSGQNWILNENIVVKDNNGAIVFGTEPGSNTQKPDPAPMNWLGYIDDATVQEIEDADLFEEGDAYHNSDQNVAYVYYKDEWQVLSSGGNINLDGFTMNPGNIGINMNVGNIFNADGVGGNYADFDYDCEANYFRADQRYTEVPTSPTAEVGGNAGAFTIGQISGQWYLFVKVQHDPSSLWKRILIPDW